MSKNTELQLSLAGIHLSIVPASGLTKPAVFPPTLLSSDAVLDLNARWRIGGGGGEWHSFQHVPILPAWTIISDGFAQFISKRGRLGVAKNSSSIHTFCPHLLHWCWKCSLLVTLARLDQAATIVPFEKFKVDHRDRLSKCIDGGSETSAKVPHNKCDKMQLAQG